MITHAVGTNGEGCEMHGQRLLNPIHVFFFFSPKCFSFLLPEMSFVLEGESREGGVLALTVMALTAAAVWCSTL